MSISAAFSAIMIVGAAVWPPGIEGITDESITLKPATPFTCGNSTASVDTRTHLIYPLNNPYGVLLALYLNYPVADATKEM